MRSRGWSARSFYALAIPVRKTSLQLRRYVPHSVLFRAAAERGTKRNLFLPKIHKAERPTSSRTSLYSNPSTPAARPDSRNYSTARRCNFGRRIIAPNFCDNITRNGGQSSREQRPVKMPETDSG